MSPEKMVHMANQIATFFRSQRDDDQAGRVAAHLRDYWDPRMRDQLKEYVANRGGENLDALVIEAARQL